MVWWPLEFYTIKGILLWSGGHLSFYTLIIGVTCGDVYLLVIHNSNKYILIDLSCQMLNGTAVQITIAAVL